MIARITTGALLGVDAYRVDVEVSLTQGLPNVFVIGLPDGAVREARMRIEAARRALGLKMPNKRVTFSLAPCDRRKAGCTFDLPMAVGLFVVDGTVEAESTEGVAFAGELALDGRLRPVRGILALARLARAEGCRALLVPAENAREAAVVDGLEVFAASDLGQVVDHLTGAQPLVPSPRTKLDLSPRDDGVDLLDVRGQGMGRRALELAAAGGHHLLYLGPPGTGKSMLARRLPGLLPPLSLEEALSVTQVYSAAGLLGDRALVDRRPFRAPHHTATEAALIGGGGHVVRVGELSLAHHGVLFLDEAAEYPRSVLDGLREPLEGGEVDICRAEHRVRLPARAQLVIALNPCPCGWHGQEALGRECTCPAAMADRYLRRLSGPLLDRIDLQMDLQPVPIERLQAPPDGESTAAVRARIVEARARQTARLPGGRRPPLNAWMTHQEVRTHCVLDDEARRTLRDRAERQQLSARGLDRVLRVARTIADLAGEDRIRPMDVLEAVSYRSLEQRLRQGRILDASERRDGRRGRSRKGTAEAGGGSDGVPRQERKRDLKRDDVAATPAPLNGTSH